MRELKRTNEALLRSVLFGVPLIQQAWLASMCSAVWFPELFCLGKNTSDLMTMLFIHTGISHPSTLLPLIKTRSFQPQHRR